MNCLICGKKLKTDDRQKRIVCRECYYDALTYVEELNYTHKNKRGDYVDTDEIVTHYYNQKNAIYRINNPEYRKNAKMTLIGLALLAKQYNERSLLERIDSDIQKINEFEEKHKKKIKDDALPFSTKDEEESAIEFDEDYRLAHQATIKCKDGHYVRSRGEKIIDDELYDHNIIHAYEKSLYIPEEPNVNFIPDFYLKNEDIYIEYWGIEGNDYYEDKRKTKENFYKKYRIKYISIENPDIDHIEDILIRRIDKIKNK